MKTHSFTIALLVSVLICGCNMQKTYMDDNVKRNGLFESTIKKHKHTEFENMSMFGKSFVVADSNDTNSCVLVIADQQSFLQHEATWIVYKHDKIKVMLEVSWFSNEVSPEYRIGSLVFIHIKNPDRLPVYISDSSESRRIESRYDLTEKKVNVLFGGLEEWTNEQFDILKNGAPSIDPFEN